MTYIENIFICMASPLLVAALCMGRRQLGFFLLCIAGMGVCLLSAYINTFLAAACRADALAATVEIAPVAEEIMKLLPLAFYLLVFEPEGEKSNPPPSRSRLPSPRLKMCAISFKTAPIAFPSYSSGASGRGPCTCCAARSSAEDLPMRGSGRG